jgi:hypothetical protein
VHKQHEDVGHCRQDKVVVKSTPTATLEMIQAEIVFVSLKVLLDVKAASTQAHAPRLARLGVEMGYVTMVGIRLFFRPIHHQQRLWPITCFFIQVS